MYARTQGEWTTQHEKAMIPTLEGRRSCTEHRGERGGGSGCVAGVRKGAQGTGSDVSLNEPGCACWSLFFFVPLGKKIWQNLLLHKKRKLGRTRGWVLPGGEGSAGVAC